MTAFLRVLGLAVFVAGITRFSLSLGLIVGGLLIFSCAEMAVEPDSKAAGHE